MAFLFLHLFILHKAAHIAQNYMFYLKRNFRDFIVASESRSVLDQPGPGLRLSLCLEPPAGPEAPPV